MSLNQSDKCTLGKFRSTEGAQACRMFACRTCGFHADEIARRKAAIHAGKMRKGDDGLMRLYINRIRALWKNDHYEYPDDTSIPQRVD